MLMKVLIFVGVTNEMSYFRAQGALTWSDLTKNWREVQSMCILRGTIAD